MHVYINWGGVPNTAVPKNCKNPFNEFLRTRPPIAGTYYTHPFVYSTDGNSLDKTMGSFMGKSIRKAVSLLQANPHFGSGRIDTLVLVMSSLSCKSQTQLTAQIFRYRPKVDHHQDFLVRETARHREVDLVEQKEVPSLGGGRSIPGACCVRISVGEPIDLFEQEQEPDWIADAYNCPDPNLPSEERPQYGKSERTWRTRLDNILVRLIHPARTSLWPLTPMQPVFEEASDELPPTQLLSSQQAPSLSHPGRQQSTRQQLERPRHLSSDILHSNSIPDTSRSSLNRGPAGRFTDKSEFTDGFSRLDASPLERPSSA